MRSNYIRKQSAASCAIELHQQNRRSHHEILKYINKISDYIIRVDNYITKVDDYITEATNCIGKVKDYIKRVIIALIGSGSFFGTK